MSIVKRESFSIGSRVVGKAQPCFIIAEVGNNHNGSMAMAKRLVDAAVNAGADAVKFQLRDMESLYGPGYRQDRASADLGAQYTLDLLHKYQFGPQQMAEILEYSRERGIIGFCTPWDERSLQHLEAFEVPLYKVASADLTNHPLLRSIAATGKPMICSSGMSREQEVVDAIALLDSLEASYAILHCNSTYPTPFKDVHLAYMKKLFRLTGIVGYSGHERGYHVPVAAVALGATIVEKHLTMDRLLEGVDHRVSLLPGEFGLMVSQIRDLEAAIGSENSARTLTQGELMNRENLGKSLVARRALRCGERFTSEHIGVLSPGQGLPPYMLGKVIGSPAKRDIDIGDVLHLSDLPGEGVVRPGV